MIYLIVGRTASGKTTFANHLQRLGLKTEVSYTTSPKKSENDTSHHFITEEKARSLTNKFLQTNHSGYEYFFLKDQLEAIDFLVIDPKGVQDITKMLPDETFTIVRIKSKPLQRKERFIKRSKEDKALAEKDYHIRETSESVMFDEFEEWCINFSDNKTRQKFIGYDAANKSVAAIHTIDNSEASETEMPELFKSAAETLINSRRLVLKTASIIKDAVRLNILDEKDGKIRVSYYDDNCQDNHRDEYQTHEAFSVILVDNPTQFGYFIMQLLAHEDGISFASKE